MYLYLFDGAGLAGAYHDIILFNTEPLCQKFHQTFVCLAFFRRRRDLDLEHPVKHAAKGRLTAARHHLDGKSNAATNLFDFNFCQSFILLKQAMCCE